MDRSTKGLLTLDQTLLDALPDGILAYEAGGRCCLANEAAARLLGVSREELLLWGREVVGLFDCSGLLTRTEETMSTGRVTSWEGAFLSAERRTVWLQFRFSLLNVDSGAVLLVVFHDVTESKEAEEALRLTQASVDRFADPVYWVSPQGRILFVNDAGCRRYGYTREEMLDLSVMDLTPELTPEIWATRWRLIKEQGSLSIELHHQTKSGEIFPVEIAANYFRHGGQEYNVAIVRDITERRRTAESLFLTQLSVDRAADLIHWLSPEGEILYVNDAACRRYGYTRGEFLGKTVFDIDPAQTRFTWNEHWRRLREEGSMLMESLHVTKKGHMFPVEVTVNYVEYQGREYNFAFARDISERRRQQEEVQHAREAAERANEGLEQAVRRANELNRQLREAQQVVERQARTDPLTGTMNRRAIQERLLDEEVRAQRRGAPLGIGLLDVDHFKRINDSLGHVAGDEVLREVAARLVETVRPYDAVGRLGGEEFLVVMPETGPGEVRSALERLRVRIWGEPFDADGNPIRVSVSAGGASAPHVPADVLVRAADRALYEAKHSGRNQVVVAGESTFETSFLQGRRPAGSVPAA